MSKADCYRLFQEVVCARDVFCRKRGCCKPVSAAHHLFGRANQATAFLPEAGIGLCIDHHIPWAHKKPRECRELAIELLGLRYFELEKLSKTVVKGLDYKEIRDGLRAELRKIKEDLPF